MLWLMFVEFMIHCNCMAARLLFTLWYIIEEENVLKMVVSKSTVVDGTKTKCSSHVDIERSVNTDDLHSKTVLGYA